MKELSVYIHIPFCVKKCNYCDFLSAPASKSTQEQYLNALLKEIEKESVHYQEYIIDTVFIGGGTPSLVDANWIVKILQSLKKFYRFKEQAEVSMEVNPGTVKEKSIFEIYLRAGINRISIGLQSTNNEELEKLGRIHTFEDFLETYHGARAAGYENINIDVMAALPGQSRNSYLETLDKVCKLKPEHISAYSLIIEEGTPFYEQYRNPLGTNLPDEDTERQMYEDTKYILENYGYLRYEISNYAKEGRQCRHNMAYWLRKDYAGFGIGAASMVDNIRFQNQSDLTDYIEHGASSEKQSLSLEEQMGETMFLGLRLMQGVDVQTFKNTFGKSIFEVYGKEIEKNKEDGLLLCDNTIRLTSKGIDISNYVMAQFI